MTSIRLFKFSPPYGDGTSEEIVTKSYYPFSPPYGDGTTLGGIIMSIIKFSPPYGDGTKFLSEQYCGD